MYVSISDGGDIESCNSVSGLTEAHTTLRTVFALYGLEPLSLPHSSRSHEYISTFSHVTHKHPLMRHNKLFLVTLLLMLDIFIFKT